MTTFLIVALWYAKILRHFTKYCYRSPIIAELERSGERFSEMCRLKDELKYVN